MLVNLVPVGGKVRTWTLKAIKKKLRKIWKKNSRQINEIDHMNLRKLSDCSIRLAFLLYE